MMNRYGWVFESKCMYMGGSLSWKCMYVVGYFMKKNDYICKKKHQIFENNCLRRQFSGIWHDWVQIVCIRVNLDPQMYVYGSILTNICMYMGGFERKSLTMHGWVYTSPGSSYASAYISSTPPGVSLGPLFALD